ncbi:hypothetical protein G6F65_021690 [Rhizopus arrhizus]|nr:hypothetical protein G6F65_021690 [Rhizopus arrhizus]
MHGATRHADPGAQRPLARPHGLSGKRPPKGPGCDGARLLGRPRRAPAARHPDGWQGQCPGGIRRGRQQRAARAFHRRPDAQPELQPDPPAGPGSE